MKQRLGGWGALVVGVACSIAGGYYLGRAGLDSAVICAYTFAVCSGICVMAGLVTLVENSREGTEDDD